jgi:hypothetical protein
VVDGRADAPQARRAVHPAAASNRRFASYQSPDGSVRGSLETFSGPEIDWLVHSWLGNPGSGFTNIHLNTWLGPQVRVPHLALVLGTIPEVFFYFDLVPRVDMHCDLDYLDRYYAPFNQMFLDFTAHPAMRRFVSREIYMRQAISPCGLCFTCPPEDEILALLECSAHRLIDQWLAWVDEAAPVPEAERAALRARDERLRRNVAERDPANALAERLLGPELTRELVGVLWGTRAAR